MFKIVRSDIKIIKPEIFKGNSNFKIEFVNGGHKLLC